MLHNKCYNFRLIAVCIFVLHFLQTGIKADKLEEPYQSWFEYAYETESLAPTSSLELYEWILASAKQNQNSKQTDLMNIMAWRLLHLYRKQGDYLRAALLLQNLSAKSKGKYKRKRIAKLFRDLISQAHSAWRFKTRVIQPLALALKSELKQSTNYFIQAVQADFSNRVLYNKILALFFINKAYKQAEVMLAELIATSPTLVHQKDYILGYAALQLQQNNFHSTIEMLQILQAENKLLVRQQHQYYYLMGRAYRGKKNYEQAIQHFQLALATSQSPSQRKRMKALVAYCYYLAGNPQLALELLGKQKPKQRSINEYILWLVLQIENVQVLDEVHLQKQKNLQAELQSLRPYLQAKNRNTPSILAQRALALIENGFKKYLITHK